MTRIVPSAMPPSEKSSVICRRRRPPMPAMMPGRQADQVDRVAEVDAVLDPDLGAEQADHAVEHHRDAAEHAARGGVDDRAELRARGRAGSPRPRPRSRRRWSRPGWRAMTPMFSAYVVVGEPPNALASAVPTPSAAMARPM